VSNYGRCCGEAYTTTSSQRDWWGLETRCLQRRRLSTDSADVGGGASWSSRSSTPRDHQVFRARLVPPGTRPLSEDKPRLNKPDFRGWDGRRKWKPAPRAERGLSLCKATDGRPRLTEPDIPRGFHRPADYRQPRHAGSHPLSPVTDQSASVRARGLLPRVTSAGLASFRADTAGAWSQFTPRAWTLGLTEVQGGGPGFSGVPGRDGRSNRSPVSWRTIAERPQGWGYGAGPERARRSAPPFICCTPAGGGNTARRTGAGGDLPSSWLHSGARPIAVWWINL